MENRTAKVAVLELFTSQGCSSCPPADNVLFTVAQKYPNLIILSFHVDYWDYLGWKDPFSDSAWSKRQNDYIRIWNEKSCYTPQTIINGRKGLNGSLLNEICDTISSFPDFILSIVVQNSRITIKGHSPKSRIFHVSFLPEESVKVSSGENKGRVLRHMNIVKSLYLLGEYNGMEVSLSIETVTGLGNAIFVQNSNGEIIGATKF